MTTFRLVLIAAFLSLSVRGSSACGQPVQVGSPPTMAAPEDVEGKESPSTADRWWRSDSVTGDWSGARSQLAEGGVRFSLFLNHQYQGVIHGGTDTNGFRSSASTDIFITFDLDKMALISGGDLLFHGQSNWGAGVNRRTGSTFEVNDDADGDLGGHVAQFWYRQRWLEGRAALTLGYLDFQTLIDRNALANSEDRQFLHQLLDNNPLVPLNIGLGASLLLQPSSWCSWTLGAGDAQSVLYKPGFSTAFHEENRWFAYAEQGLKFAITTSRGPLEGNYRAGVVYDPRSRPVFDRPGRGRPTRHRGDDYGFYAGFDQKLMRESPEDDQGLGIFGRFGYRTAATNRFSRFYSAGVSWTGMIPGRDLDVFGWGAAMSEVSDDLRRRVSRHADRETVYEVFYAIQVNPWLVITPDVQYIDHPGAAGDVSHALVTGVRARLSF